MNTRKGLSDFFDLAVWLIRKNILGVIIFLNIMLLPCFIQPCYPGWPYLTNRQYIEDSWTRGSRNASGKFDFHEGKIYRWNRNYGKYKFIKGNILEFWTSKKRKRLYLLERKDTDTMLWWMARVNGEKIGSTASFTWYRVNEKEWLKAESERKIEREKAEAERKKAEAERNKAEAEQERLERERPHVVKREGTYVFYDNDIVEDTMTGLEWVLILNRKVTRNRASFWVTNLNLDDGGWQLPTEDQLQTLESFLERRGKGDLCVWTSSAKHCLNEQGWTFEDLFGGATEAHVFAVRQSNR